MRVRTVRALLWSARSRRRIFFRAWVAIICQRVISGEWRSLRTPKFGTLAIAHPVPADSPEVRDSRGVIARAPPLVTSRERRYVFIVTWDFWDFVKNIIFLNIVLWILFLYISVI